MKKLLFTIGLVGLVSGSTPRLQADPVVALAAAQVAAVAAAGCAATGKLLYSIGEVSMGVSKGAALAAGGISMFVAYPLLGLVTADWPSQLFYAGVSVVAVAGLVKLKLDPVLKGYSKNLREIGSGFMHTGGSIALLSGALCLAHLYGY